MQSKRLVLLALIAMVGVARAHARETALLLEDAGTLAE